uniref:Uncharacterized protein n=1 Tax=Plectus sambesii TaxID=2011161 RepID=A0A914UTD4_9BILA
MSDLWSEICERRADIATVPTVVAGTKCDLPSKKIFSDTAQAWVSRLNGQVRYLEVSAKTNLRITDIFRSLLELSGFPRCKSDAALETDDMDDRPYTPSPPLRRHRSMRARTPTRELSELDIRRTTPFPPPTVSQMSQPSLMVPAPDSPGLGGLRRNRSLRLKPSKEPESAKTEVQRTLSGGDKPEKLSRSGSLIRRTKHMSLKMRRHGETPKNKDDQLADESDCKIS